MDRKQFLDDADVNDFIDWLSQNFSLIKINLKIPKHRRFIPNGVDATVTGIQNVLQHYMWKSKGMSTGDWPETSLHLSVLARNLRNAVKKNNEQDTLDACLEILRWGGDRNSAKGATPFLRNKSVCGELCQYLKNTGKKLSLQTAVLGSLCPPIMSMNAMLTKVHALYSTDGLPIYDSRVAAAIASLVELWRTSIGATDKPLPSTLTFPATDRDRRRIVNAVFPSAFSPGYARGKHCEWSSAKVRLGWIMEEILSKSPGMYKDCCPSPLVSDRMHAFEASLFMIGYDVKCLKS